MVSKVVGSDTTVPGLGVMIPARGVNDETALPESTGYGIVLMIL